ncbi:MAG: tRNA 2-thiouridine(34) synthase MnmA [Fusobacteria bacterium]|nr:tRNA 2-thiouridine(34) synthase MnmA [Fusobacteriota bacterium]
MSKRVFLGISGGVDSAVSAYLLKERGYEVIGVHLVVSETSRDEDAKKVCDVIGIKYIEYHVIESFNEQVKTPFIESYCSGETPSPCLLCNERVKFKILYSFVENENDYIATGHYAYIKQCEEFNKPLFIWDKESLKDQCYMLYRVSSGILERAIFPLAGKPKSEVRALGKFYNLPVYGKKDSQNLCFAKEGYIDFLNRYIPEKRHGNIVDNFGKILGTHNGFQQYTVGQRKGLNLNFSKPLFVLEIHPEKNEIVVGPHMFLEKSLFYLKETVLHIEHDKLSHMTLIGRARSSSKGFEGNLREIEGRYVFVYSEKNTHGSKGQHLVIYTKKLELVAGGIIDELR